MQRWSSISILFWRQDLFPTAQARLDGLWASGECPVSTSLSGNRLWNYRPLCYYLHLLRRLWDLYLGHQSSLTPTDPSSEPYLLFHAGRRGRKWKEKRKCLIYYKTLTKISVKVSGVETDWEWNCFLPRCSSIPKGNKSVVHRPRDLAALYSVLLRVP